MFAPRDKREADSVGIVGDGDDIGLIEDFEAVFAISFSDEEGKIINTLGDAYNLICSKLPGDKNQQVKCRTAMAYYRLNRALRERGRLRPEARVSPPTDISPRSFQRKLEEQSGLKLDFLTRASFLTSALFFLQFFTWIAAPVLFDGVAAFLLAISIATASHGLWRIADRMDKEVWTFQGTLGDLARKASEINFGKMASQGGRWTESEVWKTMTSIIHDHTGFPLDDMKPELKFI